MPKIIQISTENGHMDNEKHPYIHIFGLGEDGMVYVWNGDGAGGGGWRIASNY